MDPDVKQQKVELLRQMKLELELKKNKLKEYNKSSKGRSCSSSLNSCASLTFTELKDAALLQSSSPVVERRIPEMSNAISQAENIDWKSTSSILPKDETADKQNFSQENVNSQLFSFNVKRIRKSQEILPPSRHSNRLREKNSQRDSSSSSKSFSEQHFEKEVLIKLRNGLEKYIHEFKDPVDFQLPEDEFAELIENKRASNCFSASCGKLDTIDTSKPISNDLCTSRVSWNADIKNNKHNYLMKKHDEEFTEIKQTAGKKATKQNSSFKRLTRLVSDVIDIDSYHLRDGVEYLLCACKENVVVFKIACGKSSEILKWNAQRNESIIKSTLLSAQCNVGDDHTDHVVVLVLLKKIVTPSENLFTYNSSLADVSLRMEFSDGCPDNTKDSTDPEYFEHINNAENFHNLYDINALEFHGKTLKQDVCIFSFEAAQPPPTPFCVLSLTEFCFSTSQLRIHCKRKVNSTIAKYFTFKPNSAIVETSINFKEVSRCVHHFLPVSHSSSVCGISDGEINLWHYKSGQLLQKFIIEGMFMPLCRVIHQNKGFFIMAGNTLHEKQDCVIFMNPVTARILIKPLKNLLNSLCYSENLRLFGCSSTLERIGFQSTTDKHILKIFSATRGKCFQSSDLILPPINNAMHPSKYFPIVKLDSESKLILVGDFGDFLISSIDC